MRKALLTATAIAGLVLAPAVWAQQHGIGGAGESAPGAQPNKNESAPAGGMQTRPQAEPRGGEQPGKAIGEERREPGGGANKQQMREEPGKAHGEEMRERGEQPGKARGEEMREERGVNPSNQQMREERGEKSKATIKGMEQERGGATTREMQEERGKSPATAPTGRSSTFNLSSEQKTKVASTIRSINVREAVNVNVTAVRVGVSLPRTVVEFWEPAPAEIVAIVPEWRAFKVVRIHDEIVIIDPATLEIVYIIG